MNNDGAFRNRDIEETPSHGIRVMLVTFWDMCLLDLTLAEKQKHFHVSACKLTNVLRSLKSLLNSVTPSNCKFSRL